MTAESWGTLVAGLDFTAITVGIVAIIPAALGVRMAVIAIKKGISFLMGQVKKA